MAQDWKRIQLLLTPELIEQIDEWRRQEKDLPDRSEAIRRLLAQALAKRA